MKNSSCLELLPGCCPPGSSRANPAAQPRLSVGDTKSRAQGSRPGSQGCGASSGNARTPRSSSTSWSCNPKSPSASILNYHQPQQRGLPELPHTSAAEHLLLAREHAGSFPAEGRRTISSRSSPFPGRSSLGFSHSDTEKHLYTQQLMVVTAAVTNTAWEHLVRACEHPRDEPGHGDREAEPTSTSVF